MAKKIEANLTNVSIANNNSTIYVTLQNDKNPSENYIMKINKYLHKADATFNNYSIFTLMLIKENLDFVFYLKKVVDPDTGEVKFKFTDETKKNLIYSLKAAFNNQKLEHTYLPETNFNVTSI